MGFRMAPSLLSSDFARLRDEVQAIEAAGADLVHLDVMDNHYVPNLTIGPMICKAIRPHVGIPIDVHLMVRPVDALATAFADAGADIISFHPEASDHVDRTLQVIHGSGCKAGLVLNPATPLAWLDHTLGDLDVVLLMSVNPGFGGQAFIPSVVDKIRRVKALIGDRPIHIEIDGGVTPETAPLVCAAGADVLVAGSAVFKGGAEAAYRENIAAIRAASDHALSKAA